MVRLQSSDGMILPVEESVAVMSPTIKNMINHYGANKIIQIPHMSCDILNRALDYCKRKHIQCTAGFSLADLKKIKAWDDYQFVQVNKSTLTNLYKVADFLALHSLKELISQTVIKDMAAVQDTCKKTRIEKYYTKEEEEELRKTHSIPNNLQLSLGKESTEEEYSIPNDPPKERDFLTNFGKESPEDTKAEEKAWGKRKKH